MRLGHGFGLQYPQMAAAAAPAFVPSDISDIEGWWDFSDFSRLYQDSGRTTLVTAAGQTVGSVTDRSGNGLHLTQPTASKEPAVVAVGSLYGLSFDGADDWLYAVSAVTLGEHSIVLRTKFDFASGYCWYLHYSVSEYHYSYRPSGATYYLHRGSGYGANNAAAWSALGTQSNYAFVCDGSSPYGEMLRDDVSQLTITSDPGSNSRAMFFHLLADNAGTYRAQATACEVLLYSKALNASELTQIDDYLTAKWI